MLSFSMTPAPSRPRSQPEASAPSKHVPEQLAAPRTQRPKKEPRVSEKPVPEVPEENPAPEVPQEKPAPKVPKEKPAPEVPEEMVEKQEPKVSKSPVTKPLKQTPKPPEKLPEPSTGRMIGEIWWDDEMGRALRQRKAGIERSSAPFISKSDSSVVLVEFPDKETWSLEPSTHPF